MTGKAHASAPRSGRGRRAPGRGGSHRRSRRTPTPLERADERLARGRTVFLKREDVVALGAFKWRGALPALRAFGEAGATTVVTASTGNHGAATAWAAGEVGMRANVPSTTATARSARRSSTSSLGLPQPSSSRSGTARSSAASASSSASASPGTLCVGVQSRGAPVMVECWRASRIVESDRAETFADGLAARVPVPLAVDVLAEVASRMLLVSEEAIARAVGAYAAVEIRAEGAAGAALAALAELEDVAGPIVVVVTGRMIDEELWRRACEHPESFTSRA